MATLDTLQDAVNTLTSSTTELLDEVSTSKTYLDAAKAGAEDARDTALTHKTGAETAKTGAEAARDLAYSYQQSAASAVAYQDLAAIAATKTDSAVDVFVYDTRKDSDGGAWRKRCQHTSWYNETLNTSTRGSRKEFPAVAVIVAKAKKVIIYDGDDPDMPMWMVFISDDGGASDVASSEHLSGVTSLSAVSMVNGILCAANDYTLNARGGADLINFITDSAEHVTNASHNCIKRSQPISLRNERYRNQANPNPKVIVSYTVNDVAMTVLPNAPIDDATGLPIPTIAVATDGGVSVIKDDGSVVDFTATYAQNNQYGTISFLKDNRIISSSRSGQTYPTVFSIPTSDRSSFNSDDIVFAANPSDSCAGSDIHSGNYSPYKATVGTDKNIALGGDSLLISNIDNVNGDETADNCVITSSYNTGWMNGDIKLATLSDTDDADVTGAELVTNGTFDTDVSGWTETKSGSSTITYNATDNDVDFVSDGTNEAFLTQQISVVSGKTYVLSINVSSNTNCSGADARFGFCSNSDGSSVVASTDPDGTGTYTVTWLANVSSIYIRVGLSTGAEASDAITIDNISVRLAEEDRSVNGNGLQVFGTVTKNPVATGADLVKYANWSANNYLEQPYNSDFDFGTGDFCVMGWVNPNSDNYRAILTRGVASTTTGWGIRTGNDVLQYWRGNSVKAEFGARVANTWQYLAMVKSSGTVSFYLDGVLNTTVPEATVDMTDVGATIAFGAAVNTTSSLTLTAGPGSLALWRISATAPTAEQIAKIYEDEKVLFQENAKATLYGSSDAVTALAYDDDTNLLHVGTSSGRSDFNGLRRVNNTTDAVTEAISASNGLIAED